MKPRPDGEIIRYPSVQAFREEYDVAAYADRVVVMRASDGAEVVVRAGSGGKLGERQKKAIADDAPMRERLGGARTDPVAAFGCALTVQIFAGGVMIEEPTTGGVWWAWYGAAAKR